MEKKCKANSNYKKPVAKGLANVLSDVSSEKRTIESQIIQAARTHCDCVRRRHDDSTNERIRQAGATACTCQFWIYAIYELNSLLRH